MAGGFHVFRKSLTTSLLALIVFTLRAPGARAGGGAILTVLFDETTANGRLRVVSRYFEGTDRTVVTGTFFAPTGEVVTVSCDSATGECVGAWPSSASVVSRPLSNQQVAVELFSNGTEVWAGIVDVNGNFVQGSAEGFRGLMAAMAHENASALASFTAFLEEQHILEPDGLQCYTLGDRFNRNISCAASVIGLIASYPAMFTCVTIIGCPLAVGAHAAAVVGMVTSCF